MYYLKQYEKLTFTQLFYRLGYHNKSVVYDLIRLLQTMGNIELSKEKNRTIIRLSEKGERFFEMYSDFIISYVQENA